MHSRGSFAYQPSALFGWLCLAIAQAAMILRLGGKLNGGHAANNALLLDVLSRIADPALLPVRYEAG